MRNFVSRHFIFYLLCATFLFAFPRVSYAQSFSQTIPSGFGNTFGGADTFAPFNSSSDSLWQWSYDVSQFEHNGPMLINELYVRLSSSGATLAPFSFGTLEVSMIESSNDTSALASTFSNNIQRGEVVRSGSFVNIVQNAPAATTACWIPLRLDKSFLYDPSLGNDLIVQVRTCNVNSTFGANIDCVTASAGTLGRIGNQGNCFAIGPNTSADTTCPVLRMDYTPVLEQSLPAGHLNANSNGGTVQLINTFNDQTWQWHYDSSEFVSNGPITISELSIRPNSNTSTTNPFDYGGFEVTLIEAATDYRLGFHSSNFQANVVRQKVVRSGQWTGPATAPTGSGSSTWISLQLTENFDYDPSEGNDLIIQIRSCGVLLSHGVFMDGVMGFGTGSVGGNQYGHPSSCTASSSTVAGNEFVPVVKLSYTERTISTFPYHENFDNWGPRNNNNASVPPGWKNDDSLNAVGWSTYSRIHSAGTARADHTTGKTNVGWYMSTEDTDSSVLSERLETPIFELGLLSNPIATFWVYSYSTLSPVNLDENRFNVDVKVHNSNGSTSLFVSRLGEDIRLLESGCWTQYSIDLSSFLNQNVSLVFRGSTDSAQFFHHDFAIDDLCIRSKLADELGQGTTPMAKLDINDCWNINGEHVDSQSNVAGPFYAHARPGGSLHITCEGGGLGFQPLALWIAPLNINVANFGLNGQMDTGTPDMNGDSIPENLFAIGNGTSTTPSLFDLFFFTNAAGTMDFRIQLNLAFPPGILGTFQTVIGNGPAGLFLSNAVVLEITP